MSRLLRNLVLFCIPILLLWAFPLSVFWWSGEATPFSTVARLQLEGVPVIFGRAYSDVDSDFKMLSTSERDARVVALGSSRSMYIRKEFFLPEISFYNAGGVARELSGLNRFLVELPKDSRPKVLIVGIDQRWFKPDYDHPKSTQLSNDPAWKNFFGYAWKKIYQDYLGGKFSLATLFAHPGEAKLVGLTARIHASGFRNDGSYYSAGFIHDPQKQHKLDAVVRTALDGVKDGEINFDYDPAGISNSSIQSIEEFLDDALAANVTVIGYLSPHAPSLQRRLVEVNRTSIEELHRALAASFDRHHYPFFDLSDVTVFGGKDEEFIGDPWHGGDKLFARAFIYLAVRNETMARVVDVQALERAIEHSSDVHQVFPN